MKRTALVIGLILLLSPVEAQAAPEAMSAYVQKILDRAEEGIEFAKEGSVVEAAVSFFLPSFRPFMEKAGSAMLELIDTKQRIIAMEKDLNEEASKGNLIGVLRLQDLLQFLDERLELLLLGAKNPGIEDKTLLDKRMFDRAAPEA